MKDAASMQKLADWSSGESDRLASAKAPSIFTAKSSSTARARMAGTAPAWTRSGLLDSEKALRAVS